jgi:hypothetical protein
MDVKSKDLANDQGVVDEENEGRSLCGRRGGDDGGRSGSRSVRACVRGDRGG